MKKILIFGQGSERLTQRLQKLGYEIVPHSDKLLSPDINTFWLLKGKVDVIIYRVCTCCRNGFANLSKLSFCEADELTIPVVIVRGGDSAGQGYMILCALHEYSSTDEELVLAIDEATKMATRLKAIGYK